MKPNMGISYKFITEEADLKTLAMKYDVLMVATLFYLLASLSLKGEHDISFDVYTFDLSKITFRWTMGLMAGVMGSCYTMSLINSDKTVRIYQETAMLYGFLTLMFVSVNMYGFWGVVCLPFYPPMLLLVLSLLKRVKYSGFTRGFIASDDLFWKFSREYHDALWVTLLFLIGCSKGSDRKFIDFYNFEISKVSFSQTMRFLAATMGVTYYTAHFVSLFLKFLRPAQRVYEEIAMVFGLLTVAFSLMNLFGFLGIVWMLVCSPLVIFFLRLKVTRRHLAVA